MCCVQVLNIIYFDTTMKLIPGGFLPSGASGTGFLAWKTLHPLMLLRCLCLCTCYAPYMQHQFSAMLLCDDGHVWLSLKFGSVVSWCAGKTTVTEITSSSTANKTCTTSGALMASFSTASAAVLAAVIALVL